MSTLLLLVLCQYVATAWSHFFDLSENHLLSLSGLPLPTFEMLQKCKKISKRLFSNLTAVCFCPTCAAGAMADSAPSCPIVLRFSRDFYVSKSFSLWILMMKRKSQWVFFFSLSFTISEETLCSLYQTITQTG